MTYEIKCTECSWQGTRNELISIKENSSDPKDYAHCPACQSEKFQESK